MVELVVAEIMSKVADNRAYILILQEKGGMRKILVALGFPEAQAIAFEKRGVLTERPLTHDLFGQLASAFDIELQHIFINRIEDGTFCSQLRYKQGDEVRMIDSRTSDAVAIALRAGAPIYIDNDLLNRMCVHDEHNGAMSIPITAADERTLLSVMENAIKEENYELAQALKNELDTRHAARLSELNDTKENEE
ncbi:MAG: bifunctional nuclease family protein [Bacteroidaceae bacterium]|nr:bifunctional nuclease family protein [Bacteroidaceae bacterium]